MALPTFTANTTALAADMTNLTGHLTGGSGKTEAWHFRVSTSNNFLITLSEAAGATKFSLRDSAQVEVFSVDSDGNTTIAGALTLSGSFIFPVSASPSQTTEGAAVWDTDDDRLTIGTGSATKVIGLSRGAGLSASAAQELAYDTTAAALKVWNGSASVTLGDFTWIRKAATETVNNSSTLQDDDDFQFTATANMDYLVEMGLVYGSATVTPDVKFAWTLTGMTWDGTGDRDATPAATLGASFTLQAVASATTTVLATSTTAPTATLFRMTFIIHAGSTGGTLKFQWAQNSATSENTTVNKNSWLRYRLLGAT